MYLAKVGGTPAGPARGRVLAPASNVLASIAVARDTVGRSSTEVPGTPGDGRAVDPSPSGTPPGVWTSPLDRQVEQMPDASRERNSPADPQRRQAEDPGTAQPPRINVRPGLESSKKNP